MHQSGLDHEEAFDHLVDTSERTNVKLALVAGTVVAQANARPARPETHRDVTLPRVGSRTDTRPGQRRPRRCSCQHLDLGPGRHTGTVFSRRTLRTRQR